MDFGEKNIQELKVLQIIGSSGGGGAEKFFFNFIESIRTVCKIVLLVRADSWLAVQLDAAQIPYNTANFGGYLDLKTRVKISQIIEKEPKQQRKNVFTPRVLQTARSATVARRPCFSN